MRPLPKRLLSASVVAMVAVLALAGGGLSSASQQSAPAPMAVLGTNSVSAGGGYVLTREPDPIAGALTGGEYQLLGSASPSADGSGCCCRTNLPYVCR
jgi:hypothetical protein